MQRKGVEKKKTRKQNGAKRRLCRVERTTGRKGDRPPGQSGEFEKAGPCVGVTRKKRRTTRRTVGGRLLRGELEEGKTPVIK